jgi:hypothetical protein
MAAGLGFKTFTTGEVLTAADVNGYLMQGVLVFASAAARNAAITSPQEGQFAFTKDTNGLWYYDGAAWVASGATGDIEGVTAGVGISGGGTSGTVTITNDMATTITASGDIVVGTGSGTYDNLPIGTTNQVLTADTTVSPYKVKWATPASGGGMTLISTTSLTGASVTLSSIPGTYVNLQLFIENFTNSTADGVVRIAPNGGTDYAYANTISAGTVGNYGASYVRTIVNQLRTADASSLSVTFYNYAEDDFTPFLLTGGVGVSGGYSPQMATGYTYNVSGAITSLVISNSGGNWASGTAYLYGVK